MLCKYSVMRFSPSIMPVGSSRNKLWCRSYLLAFTYIDPAHKWPQLIYCSNILSDSPPVRLVVLPGSRLLEVFQRIGTTPRLADTDKRSWLSGAGRIYFQNIHDMCPVSGQASGRIHSHEAPSQNQAVV